MLLGSTRTHCHLPACREGCRAHQSIHSRKRRKNRASVSEGSKKGAGDESASPGQRAGIASRLTTTDFWKQHRARVKAAAPFQTRPYLLLSQTIGRQGMGKEMHATEVIVKQ